MTPEHTCQLQTRLAEEINEVVRQFARLHGTDLKTTRNALADAAADAPVILTEAVWTQTRGGAA
tara:strand:+ start:2487 stop:2678 length:192 start_codon:yes stop_codon:yes gene_type:complete